MHPDFQNGYGIPVQDERIWGRPGFGWGRPGFGWGRPWGFGRPFGFGFGAPFIGGLATGALLGPALYGGFGYPYGGFGYPGFFW